jgi:hypothetical protein
MHTTASFLSQESNKNFKNRFGQEFKNTRILAGDALLASQDKIRSTWILSESQDLLFQTRILTANQEKQESGKNDAKIVDL